MSEGDDERQLRALIRRGDSILARAHAQAYTGRRYRTCLHCGERFLAYRYETKRFCSRKCSATAEPRGAILRKEKSDA